MPITRIESRGFLLEDRNVAIAGDFKSVPLDEVRRRIRSCGGAVVERLDPTVDLLVVGDLCHDLDRWLADDGLFGKELLAAVHAGQVSVVRESELWPESAEESEGAGVEGLYTLAMLADLLDVPKTVLRRWHRRGYIRAAREVHRLLYYRFEEIGVIRTLSELFRSGCSLATIDRKVSELTSMFPEIERPLAELPLTVQGSRLYLRRGEGLTEPSGQLLMDFESAASDDEQDDGAGAILTIRPGANQPQPLSVEDQAILTPDERLRRLRALALEFDEQGDLDQAMETYRVILCSGKSTAEDSFLMADVLYRLGDLAGARERYFMAIEVDDQYVEAWTNLGCVLMEMGAMDQAKTAFESALALYSEYADVHYHLANLLCQLQCREEANFHWRKFLELAPASPWADHARSQLEVS